jgi:hypothetical protein
MTTMVSTSVYAKTGVEIIDFESSFHLHVFTLAESHTVSFSNVIMLLLQNGELSPLGRQTPGESLIATERQTERREEKTIVEFLLLRLDVIATILSQPTAKKAVRGLTTDGKSSREKQTGNRHLKKVGRDDNESSGKHLLLSSFFKFEDLKTLAK